MNALSYRQLLGDALVDGVVGDLVEAYLLELAEIAEPFRSGALRPIERWPYPRGPAGELQLPDGDRPHGAYSRGLDGVGSARPVDEAPAGPGDLELVVCNNGWPIEVRRCPGPLPPPLPTMSPNNTWLATQGALMVADSGGLCRLDANELAVLEVVNHRKPLGLGASDDPDEVDELAALAEDSGLAVHTYAQRDAVSGERRWMIEAARTEPFDEVLDLDAVCSYYEEALVAPGRTPVAERLLDGVAGLAGRSPAELIGHGDVLVTAPLWDLDPDGVPSSVAGAVLGHWPPATAAAHLVQWRAASDGQRYGRLPLLGWSQLRLRLSDDWR